jgi:hypothetical protein
MEEIREALDAQWCGERMVNTPSVVDCYVNTRSPGFSSRAGLSGSPILRSAESDLLLGSGSPEYESHVRFMPFYYLIGSPRLSSSRISPVGQ